MSVIYVITQSSVPLYVGKTSTFEARSKYHVSALKAGKHFNRKLQSRVDLNVSIDISILEDCDKCEDSESKWYWHFINLGIDLCNSLPPELTNGGVPHSERTKLAISAALQNTPRERRIKYGEARSQNGKSRVELVDWLLEDETRVFYGYEYIAKTNGFSSGQVYLAVRDVLSMLNIQRPNTPPYYSFNSPYQKKYPSKGKKR